MSQPYPSEALPANLSKYIYGTTRLGDDAISMSDRVKMARTAMDAGVWFHTSEQYGDALSVLAKAFSEAPQRVPNLIVKLGNDSIDELRECILRNIAPLGVEKVNVGQLCLGGALAAEFADGGKCYDGLRALQEDGLVGHFVLEVFPWTSDLPLRAFQAGHPDGLVGGCIFYYNPLQRFAANPLWDLLLERQVPVIAMRTVAGGDVFRLRDVPGAAWKPYLQERATEVAPIYQRSGIAHWSEFCVRFAHSCPLVRATVGATSRAERLQEFLDASAGAIDPLPRDLTDEIAELQRRWSDETDAQAEPWSM